MTVAAPYNVTAAVTADILEGGKAELILAVDDGSLYVMQWIHDKDDDSPRQPEAQLRLANWKVCERERALFSSRLFCSGF